MQVKRVFIVTSKTRRGIETNRGRPKRHLPSSGETDDIGHMNPTIAIEPHPIARIAVKVFYSQSLLRRLCGALNTWTRSIKNKYLWRKLSGTRTERWG
jgi:hypothetical protein